MNLIAKRTLRAFWALHPEARRPLEAWFTIVSKAGWRTPADLKATFRSADFVGDNRVVFNVGGNKYRVVVYFAFAYGRGLIKSVGIHAEYDAIDVERVR